MTATIKGNKLVIELDIRPERSSSGKSIVIASTHGNQQAPGLVHDGKPVMIGVNAYVKA